MSCSSDNDLTVLPAPGPQPDGTDAGAPRFGVGQALGPYRIERLLGRGGMGEVYEAEHLEHGRRVALKVLNQRLARADDRARFLREGQLAASLNHPNAVYVFGSEDIGGTPVIAMELVAGGTLKDVVDRDGPMAPAAAVDAILQVAVGLDAALACGILHRDVKPSNCFVESDGTVKVGDFGLSIPVLAPEVTQPGETATFQGTPQFAAPEQLRGQRLDVRADIYAVGATLYYLLTGRPPFEDRDLMALLTKVATEAPAAPSRPGSVIAPGLSAVVLRCLAKDPSARPSSYAELEAGLRPHSSAVPVPANLGLRAVAGSIDWLLLGTATAPLAIAPALALAANNSINAAITYTGPRDLKSSLWVTLGVGAITVLYYGVLEGRWGRSLGKQVCGLEVVTTSGEPAGATRAMLRALVFVLPYWMVLVPKLIAAAAGATAGLSAAGWRGEALYWGGDALALLMFSSIRHRNGYAAWHDLATGTRVVTTPRRKVRVAIDAPSALPVSGGPPAGTRSAGPYLILGPMGETAGGEMRQGFDPALKRRVWIHVLPPGAPAVGAGRTRLGRAGRLRWVNGRRAGDEAWDVYEAPDGAPLLNVRAAAQPWRVVQHWLADLARELEAASEDGSMPALALDRVWITRGSQARLLDFPAPGLGAGVGPDAARAIADPQRFLASVAAYALGAGPGGPPGTAPPHGPLPRPAQAALDTLERSGFTSLASVAERAAALTQGLDHITRPRRAASIVLANVPLAFALLALSIGLPTAVRLLETGFLEMSRALVEIRTLDGKADQESEQAREALEIYVADRFRAELADERTWQDPRTAGLLTPLRPIASRILSSRRTLTDDARRAAHAAAEARLGNPVSIRSQAVKIATVLPAVVLLLSAVAAVLSALLFRGGLLLRSLGLAVVSLRGREISRARAASRALVAWSPILLLWIYVGARSAAGRDLLDAFSNWWVPAAAAALAAAGCAWAIRNPAQGAAERLTGTTLVPR
jgi:uncharacterized RDD family membrane protein YckC